MKILEPASIVTVELSLLELRALVALIGPTSPNSQREMGLTDKESEAIDKMYDIIDDFFEGTGEEEEK